MGELKATIDRSFTAVHADLRDHGQRITRLEEYKIRAEERQLAGDRIQKQFDHERVERETHYAQENQIHTNRESLGLYRWQLWVAFLGILVAVGGVAATVSMLLR
jgi:hypothetical protein